MLIKSGVQGANYYKDELIEKFRYNPYRKINRLIAENSYRTNKILDFPLHVIIEVSSLCNLKCGFCNREAMTREKKNMDMEAFKAIVDECSENRVHSLSLYCLGEPMMNPNIREMIIYAKGRGIPYVDLSTNGMFDFNSLLGSGLDEVILSLDGFKESHELLRKGAEWGRVVNNLQRFYWERNLRNDWRPITRLQVIDLPETEKNRDRFIEWGLGRSDVVYLKNLEVFSQSLGNKNLTGDEINRRLEARQPCKQLWFVLTVNSNGEIAACCHDPQGKSVLGNINTTTLKEAWESIKESRERHRTGDYGDFKGLCSQCCDYFW